MSEIKFNQKNLDLFWRFVTERQLVWHRRHVEKQPFPWTADKILQTERFTNIYRELDPGTEYAINHILEVEAPKPDKVFNIMLYRLIGKKETHARLGFQYLKKFNEVGFIKTLEQIKKAGQRPFTAAYMVGAYTKMGSRNKVVNIARLFAKLRDSFAPFYQKLALGQSSEQVYWHLRSIYGFGNFLAFQILVDLCYPLKCYGGRPLLPFSNNDWAAAGPGAKRGVSLLSGGADELKVMRWLGGNQPREFKRLGLNFKYLKNNKGEDVPLSLANIQNCLCEFHKYVKIKNKTGRGRRKFVLSE